MANKNTFDKYRKRIVKEGILKSLFFGLIGGSIALAIVGFLTWFFDYKQGLFIAIAAFIGVTAAITPLLYFLKYRPSVKQIAQRVDALGLEERMLTMTELEGDDSFIARTQREDTMRALGSVNHMLLKIAVGAAIIVPLVVCCVLGAGMTTVSSLYYADVIPSGIVTLTVPYVPGVYTVTYSVEPNVEEDEEGNETETINGTVIYWTGDWNADEEVNPDGDKVIEGQDARAVYAIPDDGYVFTSWSDGKSDPYRHDTGVDADIFVQAIFEPMEPDPDDQQSQQDAEGEGEGQQGEGEQGEGQPQDGQPQDGEGEGESQGEGEGEGDGEGEPSDPSHSASGSRDLSSQQIVDGQTYYGDQFEDAYDAWQERQGSDSNIPDDLKGYIEDYFGSIETSGNSDGSGESGNP